VEGVEVFLEVADEVADGGVDLGEGEAHEGGPPLG
jgi:hypothetical protein